MRYPKKEQTYAEELRVRAREDHVRQVSLKPTCGAPQFIGAASAFALALLVSVARWTHMQ